MTRAWLWAELGLALGIFAAANFWHALPIGETPWLLMLGWISLRLRGRGWGSLGLVRPANWGQVIAVALGAAIGLQLLSTFVTEPLITLLSGRPTDLSKFRPLVGNLKLVIGMLVVVWTLAAFGEELVYRGYLLNRGADLGYRTRRAWIASYLSVSLLFGFGHLYQGPTGVADTTVTGLLLGGLYLGFRRNLWIPILTHGLSDTIALVLVFLDLVPTLH
jgi:membrane protease YdiL (CAAX protease family)